MKNMKRILSLLLVMIMVLSLVACGQKKENSDKPTAEKQTTKNKVKVGMVTDTGGINDRSFNETSWKGIQEYKDITGNEITYVESAHADDYKKNIENLVDQEAGMVWGIGYALGDHILLAARQNAKVHFANIDWAYGEDQNGKYEIPKNLTGIIFKAQEPSFLVGYIAGLTTETNKVGFVGGQRGFIIDQFEYGFRAGVKEAAKELGKQIEVDVQYAESFTDAAKGKGIAGKMYATGSDIVFHAAGGVGVGVIEAAIEANKKVIGVDTDQAHLAPKNMLTSALKRVDFATRDLSLKFANGEEIGGKNFVYGLKEGGVGIPPMPKENPVIKKEVYDKAIEKQKELIDGKIVPPFNEKTWKEYK